MDVNRKKFTWPNGQVSSWDGQFCVGGYSCPSDAKNYSLRNYTSSRKLRIIHEFSTIYLFTDLLTWEDSVRTYSSLSYPRPLHLTRTPIIGWRDPFLFGTFVAVQLVLVSSSVAYESQVRFFRRAGESSCGLSRQLKEHWNVDWTFLSSFSLWRTLLL